MQDPFWGILIPFLGTSLGAGRVFFLKKFSERRRPAGVDWLCCRSHAVCGGGGTDPGNVAGAALQRWYGVFCGGLQCDDGAGRSTGVMVGGRKRNLFRNLRKYLNFLTEETAGRIILAEGPLRSGFL